MLISRQTCLGKHEEYILDNNVKLNKCEFWNTFLQDLQDNFKTISHYDHFDYHLSKDGFTFGIEASYKYDDTQIIYIDFLDVSNSFIEEGRAWGYYGSQCLTKRRYYKDYVRKSKFIRFCNKWQLKLKNKLKPLLEKLLNEK
jgi:hypothetical protein